MSPRCLALALTPFLFASAVLAVEPDRVAPQKLELDLRTRVQPFKSGDDWVETSLHRSIPPRETAIIICDMWDDHWCKSAARRCAAMAQRMEPVLKAARARGVTIIHAPSDCMDFYKDAPQRKKMLALPKVEVPKPRELPDPPLPIDDKEGGCDDPVKPAFSRAWTREHPALTIADEDYISDKGAEVYALLKEKGINTVFICGVHTNMCVLHRTFAIKQMTRWGVRCILIRDLTDSMYNPKSRPFVSHDEGTSLVIEHIERHWCPSVLSKDLLERK
jgi:nicotinamidase-related amidase